MANACVSPRANIEQITKGVGTTQQTTAKSTDAANELAVIESPNPTATIVTAINNHAKLNRNRRIDDHHPTEVATTFEQHEQRVSDQYNLA